MLEDPFDYKPMKKFIVPEPFWILLIIGLVAVVAMISSCATKPLPICGRFTAYTATHPEMGAVLVIDAENAEKLRQLIDDAANGKCRLMKQGET